jgi:4-hydroxybenzoyl-CoA thioesterase
LTETAAPTPVNRRTVRIEWGDCDPAGIVWYPRYFGMFDAATAYLFEAAGFPKPAMLAQFEVVGYPMVDTRAKFLIPSKFGEDIVIESRVSAFRRSSFDIEHRVFKGEALAIEGFETRVLVKRDPATGGIKGCPIPQEIIAAFG